MGRGKTPLVRLSDLTQGQFADFFALLAKRSKSETRDGKPYFNCRFRDARRTVSLMVWSDSDWYEICDREWREGQFYRIHGVYAYNERFGHQIEVRDVRIVVDADKSDGFDPSDFVERSRFDPEVMFIELKELASTEIADVPLRRLVLTLLDRHADGLKQLPATLNRFFSFRGGLLEHLLSVTRSCLFLADKYIAHYGDLKPPLNRDLIVAGAILHDIGRVAELADDALTPHPTVPGRLFGHLFLGRDLIRDAARELGDVHPELLQILEHIVITHLTLPEWGSPRLPLVPECLIIHHADDLDAKMEMYARCFRNDKEDGPFTARDPVLVRQLYKGRTV
jgi:3'-5' exoribonuclease